MTDAPVGPRFQGGNASEPAALSQEQRDDLREGVAHIAARTREYLPGDYAVGSEITHGASGTRVTVAVRPPSGHPVSAGLEPDLDADQPLIGETDRVEVARGLAASAALQAKQANDLGDGDRVAR